MFFASDLDAFTFIFPLLISIIFHLIQDEIVFCYVGVPIRVWFVDFMRSLRDGISDVRNAYDA